MAAYLSPEGINSVFFFEIFKVFRALSFCYLFLMCLYLTNFFFSPPQDYLLAPLNEESYPSSNTAYTGINQKSDNAMDILKFLN